jgi:drug/metabolite transporter (DMT)-like permease
MYNLLGAVALGLAIVAMKRGPTWPSSGQVLVLVAFGVIQMAIPYILFARGLRVVDAAEAGLIALVEPILNPIWVVIFVHERPATPTLVGGSLLLLGVVYRYLPALRRRSPIPSPSPAPPSSATSSDNSWASSVDA